MSESVFKRGLCWLRRDLRWSDHRALKQACEQCEQVAVVFVFDSNILSKLKDKSDRRLTVIHDALEEVDQHLTSLGSQLIVTFGDPVEAIPEIAKQLQVNAVFCNEDYEAYAKKRDLAVQNKLKNQDCSFFSFKDQVIFSGEEVLKSDGSPYQVFTPYKKSWINHFHKSMLEEVQPNLRRLMLAKDLKQQKKLGSLEEYGFSESKVLLPTGRSGGLQLLNKFEESLKAYDQVRDFPSKRGTSKISVHLRFGTLSVREAFRLCASKKNKGAQVWMSELIWREFYFMILDQFPHVETESFKPQYNEIQWPGEGTHFKAWCEGRTGFPIVDAGMRQLNETGFMHNRLRMITASFLVKDLLVDWKKGESYFAEKLLDFDLAANNGGWQWCASTGCDAQPYFRIFNPDSQQKRFDPEGKFIRQWIPELDSDSYPQPIVNHKVQRDKALKLFKVL